MLSEKPPGVSCDKPMFFLGIVQKFFIGFFQELFVEILQVFSTDLYGKLPVLAPRGNLPEVVFEIPPGVSPVLSVQISFL